MNKVYSLPTEAQFSVKDVARLNGIHQATAAAFVKEQLAKNVIVKSGKLETGKKGKPAALYSVTVVQASLATVETTPTPVVETPGTPIEAIVNSTVETPAEPVTASPEPVSA